MAVSTVGIYTGENVRLAYQQQRVPGGWRIKTSPPTQSTAPFLSDRAIELKLSLRGTTDVSTRAHSSRKKTLFNWDI